MVHVNGQAPWGEGLTPAQFNEQVFRACAFRDCPRRRDHRWLAYAHGLLDKTDSYTEAVLLEAFLTKYADWRVEPQFHLGGFRYDFRFEFRLLVECDSIAWHSTPQQLERDAWKDQTAKHNGFAILRLTGRQILRYPDRCAEHIATAILDAATMLPANRFGDLAFH